MLAHFIDHFFFTARRLTEKAKSITFYICVALIVGTFWWFSGMAFGIDGPIKEHKGLLWRKVSLKQSSYRAVASCFALYRVGTFMSHKGDSLTVELKQSFIVVICQLLIIDFFVLPNCQHMQMTCNGHSRTKYVESLLSLRLVCIQHV